MDDSRTNTPSTQDNVIPENICPFLGLEFDPQTCFQYPSHGNFCHKSNPPQSLDEDYQQQSCLTEDYPQCKVYSADVWEGHLPSEIGVVSYDDKTPSGRIIALVLVGLIIIIGGVYLLRSNIIPTQSSQESLPSETSNFAVVTQMPSSTQDIFFKTLTPVVLQPSETLINLLLPSIPEYNPALTSTPMRTSTLSTTPTISATSALPTAGPDMGTPFGPRGEFVLHIVQTGESLSSIAVMYETTIDVIRASNVLIEGASVWPDTVLLIVPGETRPENATRYIVIYLEKSVPVSSLAQEYNVTTDQLRQINILGSEQIIPGERWIIIPVNDA